MNWIKVNDDNEIPADIMLNRTSILLEDCNGMIGVGWWNSYSWVLDLYHDIDVELCFDKIIRYALLD